MIDVDSVVAVVLAQPAAAQPAAELQIEFFFLNEVVEAEGNASTNNDHK